MSWNLKKGGMVASIALALVGAVLPAEAARVKVGDEIAYPVSTPKVYPMGGATRPVAWAETIVSPGAKFLRLHFQKLNLPDGDFLTVSSPDGAEFWTYTGKGPLGTGEFWSFSVDGDVAIVELHTGDRIEKGRARRYGASIDRIAHGTEPLWGGDVEAKVICGTDGRRDAACYSTINTRPVARLSFQSGGSSFVCTGWLVAGSNSSTTITNNHCFTTQSEVNTVQARFNYQRTTCGGSTTAAYSTYNGGTFLKTSSSLDYTLFTLQGNPEATWGEYTATTKTPAIGMAINFPQHGGGNVKTVGFWKDSAQTLRCDVAATGGSYGYATGSQMDYSCDSEGGSSGSPIMDAGTGRIIGLHHLGGVSSSPCENAGTMMKNVCPNAGALLACATN
ncbi:MAG TPA: trypsin-like peptidase domain-containing protein [Thermoanaerobaculia bacterium]|nr:trypsin-like peptidase domain-containing protein [Thermoanaerobaculia bacterium]